MGPTIGDRDDERDQRSGYSGRLGNRRDRRAGGCGPPIRCLKRFHVLSALSLEIDVAWRQWALPGTRNYTRNYLLECITVGIGRPWRIDDETNNQNIRATGKDHGFLLWWIVGIVFGSVVPRRQYRAGRRCTVSRRNGNGRNEGRNGPFQPRLPNIRGQITRLYP